MRCNKCGEEYKDNQAFCLRCGNPIHVVPDFNLIEAELANDVGALMDSENEENKIPEEFDEAEAMKTVNVPVEDISMELKMVDINRGRFNFEEDDLSLIDEDEEEIPQRKPVNRPANKQPQRSGSDGRTSDSKTSSQRNGNGKKAGTKPVNNTKSILKNICIMFGCALAIAIVVLVLKKVVFSDSLNDSNNFKKQYEIAKEYYDDNKKSEAITEAKKAVQVAYSSAEVLKARKLLHDIYEHFEVYDDEYVQNMLKIVELEPSNTKYNEALLDYYYNNKMFTEFNNYFATLEGKGNTDSYSKYLPEKPVASLEGGHYDTFLTIELSGAEGTTIYYTLDGSDPKGNKNAFQYVEAIALGSEGTTKILAYVIDVNGIMSETFEVEYIIEDVEVSGPVVTPSSGVYNQYQNITVTAPEGYTVYYTFTTDETTPDAPTSASTQYTEPIEMPYGRSDFKFVCIDANGIASNVTSVTYSLSLERTVKIADAQTLVKDKCIKEKELDADAKDKDELQYEFMYKDMLVINNAEYYIIEVSVEDDSIEPEYYAVHTNEATVTLATRTDDGYTLP